MPLVTEYALNDLSDVKSEKLHNRWHAQVEYLAQNDKSNAVRANALNVLGEWNMTDTKQILITAVGDSSTW